MSIRNDSLSPSSGPQTPEDAPVAHTKTVVTPPAWRQRWHALSLREKQAAGLAMTVVGAVACWTLALRPLLHAWQTLPTAIESAQDTHLRLTAMAAQAQRWSAAPQSRPLGSPQASLQSLLLPLGPGATLQATDDTLTVSFSAASGPALMVFLTQARQQARAYPVSAQWQEQTPGQYGGEIRLQALLPAP